MAPSDNRPNPFALAGNRTKATSKGSDTPDQSSAGLPAAGATPPMFENLTAPARPRRKTFAVKPTRHPLKHPRGLSLLATRSRLETLPMQRATLLSVAMHVVSPIVCLLIGLVVLFLLGLNPFDWFKPETKPDMTFTIVQDRKEPPPKQAQFKGNFNQNAGGPTNKKPPVAVEDEVAPDPKPIPQPVQAQPKQATTQPTPPQEQPKAPTPEDPKPVPAKTMAPTAVAKPAKVQAQAAANTTSLAAASAQALSSALSSSATPSNPQAGKARQPGVDVAQDVAMGKYMAQLEKRMKIEWLKQGVHFPKDISAKLRFYVRRDGTLKLHESLNPLDPKNGTPIIEIQKSSGNGQYDQWAINAVMNAADYEPLPPEMKYDVVPIDFNFQFDLKELK